MGEIVLGVMFQIWPPTKCVIKIEIVGSRFMVSRFVDDQN